MSEPKNVELTPGLEAAVRAKAEELGYRPGELIDDHMAIVRAALDAVRSPQDRDAVKFLRASGWDGAADDLDAYLKGEMT